MEPRLERCLGTWNGGTPSVWCSFLNALVFQKLDSKEHLVIAKQQQQQLAFAMSQKFPWVLVKTWQHTAQGCNSLHENFLDEFLIKIYFRTFLKPWIEEKCCLVQRGSVLRHAGHTVHNACTDKSQNNYWTQGICTFWAYNFRLCLFASEVCRSRQDVSKNNSFLTSKLSFFSPQ